jgi:uncharacterized protein YecT (DUF1311 family)
MHKPMLPLFLAFALLIATAANADDPTGTYFDGDPIDCPGATSEVQYNRCASAALQKADLELNALYKRLMAAADADEKRHLQDMQLAWIKLKDAQCRLVRAYHEGAANPEPWKTRCEAMMTMRRVRELTQLGTGILWNIDK